MQTGEWLLLSVCCSLLLLFLVRDVIPLWLSVVCGVGWASAFVFHGWFDGLRWQMIPAYFAGLLCGILLLRYHLYTKPQRTWGRFLALLFAGVGPSGSH